jgi:hypothetical protein
LPLRFAIPDPPLEIAHLLFDVNGTLTDRGLLIDGVGERLARLREDVAIQLLSSTPSPAVTTAWRAPRMCGLSIGDGRGLLWLAP